MAYLGNLSTFDYKSCEWSIFKGRLTQFIKINRVEEVNKTGILLTHFTDDTYRLARDLAYPRDLESLSYADLVTLLDNHFKAKQCSYADRAKFYGAIRSPGETLGDWAARIRGLASYCDFGAALETNLTDRFVLGLGPGSERDKLFEQSPSGLNIAQALDIARRAECAKEARTIASGAMAAIKDEVIYRVSCGEACQRNAEYARRGRASGSSPRGAEECSSSRRQRSSTDGSRCLVCGMKNHKKDQCRYKNYRCQKCGEKGHLKKVCGQDKVSRVHNIIDGELETETDDTCEECQNFNMRYVTNKPIELTIMIGNRSVKMELDSGSGTCVISDRMYGEIFSNYQLHTSNIKMCLYNGHKISPVGYFWAEATFNNKTKTIKIFVVKNGGPPLLGRDFMSAFDLVLTTKINHISYDIDVHTLLEQFPELWRDELGSFNKFKVHLQLKDNSAPKFFKPRTVPFALKDKVEKELERLVNLGILIPVSHSQYATPIVPVVKENGQVRIAGDFSVTLNKDLVIDKYPLPRIEEVFAKLGGGKHYSKIDLKNAYNQFLLTDTSQDLTTINTSKGLFKYTRLVYGLANAPAIFQKSMETLLSGIDGVSCWLDDICVTGPDRKSHLLRLTEVLKRLNDAGLRLQKEKCDFFKPSVTYLGYTIDKDGLRTSRQKVQAIINAPEPTNVKDVKRFLGVVNYYRSFIPNASSIMSPLHELLCAGVEWQWGERQRRAVQRIRAELASERVLAHFDPSAQLVLAVDAGPSGLGAVLSQRDPDGHEKPLAFGSRSLATSERNYSQIQKEATAIIFGVKRFHQYLYGRNEPFILKTDHRPLVSIFNNKTGISVTTALRLQRYAIILSAYNYVVQYTSSENNVVADYFSRAPVSDTVCESDKEYDTYCSLKFLDAVLPAVSYNDIFLATKNDETLQTVIRYMKFGWPRKICCKWVRPYFQCRTDLQVENGILLRGHKVVIPSSLRNRMLNELHNSHLGIVKMKCNARSRMWWPGIDDNIESWIGACDTCIKMRNAPPREAPCPWPRATTAWYRIHIDYLSIGQKVYLVVVDAYSKWLECLYMNNGTNTQALIVKLKYIFSMFGIPNILVSDNDVKINSVEFKTFCSNNGIKYMTSPIYHPCSNGQAENSVRICKKMIKNILSENSAQHVTHEKLLDYLFDFRNTIHCTTGQTPAKLMFGRKLRSRLDLILPPDKRNIHSNEALFASRRHFKVGDVVWTRCYNARKAIWLLGLIKEKIGNRMFNVFIYNHGVTCKRHIDQLLVFKGLEKGRECDAMQSPSLPAPPMTASPVEETSEQIAPVVNQESSELVQREIGQIPTEVFPNEDVGDCALPGEDCERQGSSDTLQTQALQAPEPVHSSETNKASEPRESRPKRTRKKVDYTVFF